VEPVRLGKVAVDWERPVWCWMMKAEADYPPPPWRLDGSLQAGIFLLSSKWIPALGHDRLEPVKLLGRSLVCVVWGQYGACGDLSYNEALVAVLVRHLGHVTFTIPQIWVDDIRSALGGRELWAIPKEIGQFDSFAPSSGTLALRVAGMTAMTFEPRPAIKLPGRWRLPLPLLQPDGKSLRKSRGRVRGDPCIVNGQWRFSPQGPLSWMIHATPIASGALAGATLNFGQRD
jgi:hypothetical protein